MLADVVNHTNHRMDMLVESLSPEQLENPNRTKYQHHMQHTDITEIKAFIGIYYLRGLMKENFSHFVGGSDWSSHFCSNHVQEQIQIFE